MDYTKVDGIRMLAEFNLYYEESFENILNLPWSFFVALCEYKAKNTKVINRIFELIYRALTSGK